MIEKDLWIGDMVRLRKSNRVGKYEGKHQSGKARVRIGNKIVLSPYPNLEVVNVSESKPGVSLVEDIGLIKMSANFEANLDLHIEKLDPSLQHQSPQIILRRQLTACKAFIEKAIQLEKSYCTIIHGLGKGALRNEVNYLLNQYDEVIASEVINDGGATTVRFRYH